MEKRLVIRRRHALIVVHLLKKPDDSLKLRNKISFFEKDWIKRKAIAKYYKEKEGINVSPGQIASVLRDKQC